MKSNCIPKFKKTGFSSSPPIWKNEKINDVCDIFSGGTPSTSQKEYWNGDIPWLSSGETRNNFILETERKITLLGVKNSSTRLAKKQDIVMASAGQGSTRGHVSLCLIDTYVNQSVVVFRPNKKINPEFLFYNLKSRYDELRRISDSHSSRGSLPKSLLLMLEIPLPPLSTQHKISSSLFVLDKLIQNLQQQNQILEKIIRSIFKSWFIDFDGQTEFVDSELGQIPRGWKIKKLHELFQIFAGGDLSKIIFSKTKTNEYKYPVYSNSLNHKGLYGYSKTYQYQPECVTITARGEVGRAEYRNDFFNAIVRLLVLKPKYDFSCSYAVSFINSKLDFSHVGSAVNQLTVPAISDRVMIVPSSNLLENFEKIFHPLQKKIDLNSANISTLEQTRDPILPKLMSGEIRV